MAPRFGVVLVALAAAGCARPGRNDLVISLSESISQGTVECLICGASEEHRHVDGRLDRAEPNPPNDYNRWYVANVGTAHEHDWVGTGCHFTQSGDVHMVACHLLPTFEPYHDAIMKFPDLVIARRLLRGLTATTAELRSAVLKNTWMDPSSTARRFKDLSATPAQEFAQAWDEFLADHPAWLEIWTLGQ